jgi:outer membrane receptor for ferrienterochelin and colicin
MTRESDRVGTGSILLEAQFDKSYLWKSSISLEYNRDMVRSGRENTLPDGSVTARRGLYPDRSQYANAAISNTHRVDLDPWQFELGWRFHSYAISMYDTTMGNISIKPSAWVYFAGTSLRLKKDWVLFMNVNTGYRAPNIDDMGTVGIVDFRYEVPAYDLRPERSLNKEIGIRYLAPKTRISASLFHTGFKDLIARVKTNETVGNYFVYVKQNVEESYIWGAETEGRVSAGQRLEFSANLTYLFGHNITRDEPMRRIPPLNGTLFVRYKTKPLQFNLEMEKAGWQRRLAQGDKDDKRIPMGGTPGYTLFHISAVGECKAIQYRILLYNLFNRDFRTHGSGINGMGRSLSATLVFTFASQK